MKVKEGTLPGQLTTNDDVVDRIRRTQKSKSVIKDSTLSIETDVGILKLGVIIVGALLFMCIIMYFRRKYNERERTVVRFLEREMIGFIHASVHSDCSGARGVPREELMQKFGKRSGYNEAIRFLSETIFRDIDFHNDTFLSLTPKFPRRCRIHRYFVLKFVFGVGIITFIGYLLARLPLS
jgi:hypothetical protein